MDKFSSMTATDTDDLPRRLAVTFQRIQKERMADVPILNPYLCVEAVGFRRWQGQWAGILITPWLIGLYLLPGDEANWPRVPRGGRCTWNLPKGDYVFLVDQEEGFGPYHVCTLMSPVKQFSDQATARASAEALLEQIFARSSGEATGSKVAEESQEVKFVDPQLEEPLAAKGVTRRDFLRKFRDRS